MAGALMVVTLSIGEFNMTWMLHTPLTKTLPLGLADGYASMRLEAVLCGHLHRPIHVRWHELMEVIVSKRADLGKAG